MSAGPNLAVAFGAVLAGAVVIDYGIKSSRQSIQAAQASAATPSTISSSGTVNLPAGGATHGIVSIAALGAVGAKHGWTTQQVADWMKLVVSESNGTLSDKNPASGAYGIAQFINGPGEYYSYGGDPNSLSGQLTAMGNYIAKRYGNPSAAWQFHLAHNWY